MNSYKILATGKCCITGKPLSDCKQLYYLQLQYKATWPYPVWGNILTGITNMAIAYVHDECIVGGVVVGTVINAVEFKDDEIIYHPVKDLVCVSQPTMN